MTTQQPANPPWFDKLLELINTGFQPDDRADGGAQLKVYEPDNPTPYFRQPLARHARLDEDCVWIRPIVGLGPGFDLHDDCRRRGITTRLGVTHTDTRIRFQLGDGCYAEIIPADPEQHAVLERWDVYMLVTLTPEEEAAAEALDGDSWYYPH